MPDTIHSLQQELATLKKENQAFQESQLRFTTVFEESRLGNKIIGPDLKILQVNAAMVALLGYAHKEELIGTKIVDYATSEHHKDWAFLQEKLWKKLTPSFSLETRLTKKDGTTIWCQVTSILFPDNGQTLGYTIIEDVTEKYILRQQKEEFISVASHELKTPITSLKATLQMLTQLTVKESDVPEKFKKLILAADRSTTKLTHLVADLLNTTKIEQGELAMNKNSFVVWELVDSCCSHIQLDGKYHIHFQGERTLHAFGDFQKIEQVVVNFITNAIKYATRCMNIVVQAEKIPGAVKIMVIDQGEGVPAGELNKLFERYYRAKQNNTRTSGLGLGLYISAEIIRRHGGQIGVDRVIGGGSSFWFTLPDQN